MLGWVFKQNDRTETQMKKTEMTATPCVFVYSLVEVIKGNKAIHVYQSALKRWKDETETSLQERFLLLLSN